MPRYLEDSPWLTRCILPQRIHHPPSWPPLLRVLRGIIQGARQQVLRQVDTVQVQTYWEIGRHIVEFEQGGSGRAPYGKGLLTALARDLTAEFGKGFDASNLRYMRLFYGAFPIRDALRHELSWMHYRLLQRVENENAGAWYLQEAVAQNWSTRALERQISTLYYGRLLASSNMRRSSTRPLWRMLLVTSANK